MFIFVFNAMIVFVFRQTDPKGSLPSSIVNQVNLAQPKSIIIAKQLLEKRKQSNTLLRSVGATVSYQGNLACDVVVAFWRLLEICLSFP
jgi:hypothetical protein